jgi:hypothetical protein
MTIPTKVWNIAIGTHGQGGYEAYDSTPRDAVDMITDLVSEIIPVMPDSVTFDDYVIYVQPAPENPEAFAVGGGSLALDGLDTTPGWIPAVQATYTYYDGGFRPGKLVLLDAASNNNFSKLGFAAMSDIQKAPLVQLGLESNAWASRAGNRPSNPRNLLFTLNRKLRKQYGLT